MSDLVLQYLFLSFLIGTAGSFVGMLVGTFMARDVLWSAVIGATSGVVLAFLVFIGVVPFSVLNMGPIFDGLLLATVGAATLTALVNLFRPAITASEPIASFASAPPKSARSPAPSRTLSAEKIFISYRRDDSLETTGRIYDRLAREFGEGAVFRDFDNMPFGVDFREHIDRRLSDCDICMVVIGPKWLTVADASGARRIDDPRDHVRVEIETALRRNIRVVPLLIGGAPIPAESALPPSLAPLSFRAGTHIRPDPDFHRDIDRRLAGLQAA